MTHVSFNLREVLSNLDDVVDKPFRRALLQASNDFNFAG